MIPLALTLLAVAGYSAALTRLRRRGDWSPPSRTNCLAGSLCVAAAVLPPVSTRDGLFPVPSPSTCCWG